MGFRTSRFWFPATPLSCHPNYRALTFALAGLFPAEHTSLSWLQPLRQRMIMSEVASQLRPTALNDLTILQVLCFSKPPFYPSNEASRTAMATTVATSDRFRR